MPLLQLLVCVRHGDAERDAVEQDTIAFLQGNMPLLSFGDHLVLHPLPASSLHANIRYFDTQFQWKALAFTFRVPDDVWRHRFGVRVQLQFDETRSATLGQLGLAWTRDCLASCDIEIRGTVSGGAALRPNDIWTERLEDMPLYYSAIEPRSLAERNQEMEPTIRDSFSVLGQVRHASTLFIHPSAVGHHDTTNLYLRCVC